WCGPPGDRVIELSSRKESPTPTDSPSKEDLPIREQCRRMPTPSFQERPTRLKPLLDRIEELDRREIAAVIAAGNEHPSIGQQRGRMAGARLMKGSNLTDGVTAGVKQLDAGKATLIGGHSPCEQHQTGGKGGRSVDRTGRVEGGHLANRRC